MKFKISDLILVKRDDAIIKSVSGIKEFLESKNFKESCNSFFAKEFEISVEFQGSYDRHTASFVGKDSKSDVDIILYIGNYSTCNLIQKYKGSLDIYTKNMSSSIKNNLNLKGLYVLEDSFIPLEKFVELKNYIYQLL